MLDEQRQSITTAISALIERLSTDLGLHPEAVADVAFLHIQKHPSWGRNPTKKQKKASHLYWKGLCQNPNCKAAVDLDHSVFHHLSRRIPNQHGPENMLPYHGGCHDTEHKVTKGSLLKGSLQRRK